jgi:hypothetical protein
MDLMDNSLARTASKQGRLPWISRKTPRLIHGTSLCPQAPQPKHHFYIPQKQNIQGREGRAFNSLCVCLIIEARHYRCMKVKQA